MLQRLLNLLRRDRRRVVVPTECPWLADPQAVPVTELPPAPTPRAGPRWPWLPGVVAGVLFASLIGVLSLLVAVVLNLRRTDDRPARESDQSSMPDR
jgi:hypothetical protein